MEIAIIAALVLWLCLAIRSMKRAEAAAEVNAPVARITAKSVENEF